MKQILLSSYHLSICVSVVSLSTAGRTELLLLAKAHSCTVKNKNIDARRIKSVLRAVTFAEDVYSYWLCTRETLLWLQSFQVHWVEWVRTLLGICIHSYGWNTCIVWLKWLLLVKCRPNVLWLGRVSGDGFVSLCYEVDSLKLALVPLCTVTGFRPKVTWDCCWMASGTSICEKGLSREQNPGHGWQRCCPLLLPFIQQEFRTQIC